MQRAARDDTPHVEQRPVRLQGRRRYAEERARNPEAYDLLGSNPLPDTFRVTPDKPDNIAKLRDALAPPAPGGGRTTIDPAIDDGPEPQGRHEQDPLGHARGEAHDGAAGRAARRRVVLLISNTIRLSLYARRREVEVMKLVGATDWFIRWPFVIEGVIVGALGGLLAILLLGVGKVALLDPLVGRLRADRRARDDQLRAARRACCSARVGRCRRAGSGLSLRRFLRV